MNQTYAEAGPIPHAAQLVLIQNGSNLGFAGGNNVGLRFALRDPALQYFWLLNNDTVVQPGALSALVRERLRVLGVPTIPCEPLKSDLLLNSVTAAIRKR